MMIYEKLGKSMEGVKATVTRIFETSVKTGDIELGKKQIGLIVDLVATQFNQLKSENQQLKDN